MRYLICILFVTDSSKGEVLANREDLAESTPALNALNVMHVKVEIPEADEDSPNSFQLNESSNQASGPS